MQVCAPAKEIKRIALVWNKIYKGQCLAARATREILASLGPGEPYSGPPSRAKSIDSLVIDAEDGDRPCLYGGMFCVTNE
jgi:hypothetical protein